MSSCSTTLDEGECDGSDQSRSPEVQKKIDNQLTAAMANVETFWTGPWPLLHIRAFDPDTSDEIVHMAVDLLGSTTVYSSDAMGANEEDFINELAVAGFGLTIGLMTYGLMIVCAVADKAGWTGVAAVIVYMTIILGYAWWVSHGLVDNGQWAAGSAAAYFLILFGCYLGIAAGWKKIGGISGNIILGFLARIMKVSVEAIKGAVKFTNWSRVVFIIMALVFLVYYLHFLTYEG